MQTKKFVYIASPYSGDEVEGVNRQMYIASILIDAGFVPIWPLCSHFIHEKYPKNYEVWMDLDFQLILKCDYMYRVNLPSSGADREEQFAKENKIPVFYDIDDLMAMGR